MIFHSHSQFIIKIDPTDVFKLCAEHSNTLRARTLRDVEHCKLHRDVCARGIPGSQDLIRRVSCRPYPSAGGWADGSRMAAAQQQPATTAGSSKTSYTQRNRTVTSILSVTSIIIRICFSLWVLTYVHKHLYNILYRNEHLQSVNQYKTIATTMLTISRERYFLKAKCKGFV